MVDPLPDARLRDDVAQQIFTQALSRLEGVGDTRAADRKTLLEDVARLSYEAAEAFVQADVNKIKALLDVVAGEAR